MSESATRWAETYQRHSRFARRPYLMERTCEDLERSPASGEPVILRVHRLARSYGLRDGPREVKEPMRESCRRLGSAATGASVGNREEKCYEASSELEQESYACGGSRSGPRRTPRAGDRKEVIQLLTGCHSGGLCQRHVSH